MLNSPATLSPTKLELPNKECALKGFRVVQGKPSLLPGHAQSALIGPVLLLFRFICFYLPLCMASVCLLSIPGTTRKGCPEDGLTPLSRTVRRQHLIWC